MKSIGLKHFAIVLGVTLVWTLIVIGFSTTMGSRPLRIYDWGPPVGACLLTLICMIKDRVKQDAR
ncbi:hypothetical protein [Bordetella avium]|uniref:hypothetical protein n=1 Tax=Bordetella avium TaxID=521 RepID=UPI0003032C05|nr:hypothetical protein [Bordetella avium]AZY48172.1 hypothetical protein C0J09_02750 [Bordetella avium]AZY51552.1 hypothetical protein C0J07_02805 [Bordetella avium]RIQ14594.1 hypothetical protein D0432_00120 [Bordetella avium]RIQ16704.1 hypothetical protein D0850_13035 [Bordetella avium]RIQ35038.1 hypothetical protein D0849_03180 [Bordetella avium]